MREYERLKRLSYLEFSKGNIAGEDYRDAMILAQEVQNHLYNICETRMQYAIRDPERWHKVIEVNVAGDSPKTEKQKLEVVREVSERRYANDEKLVEFDGYLRMQAMRKQLEQDFNN